MKHNVGNMDKGIEENTKPSSGQAVAVHNLSSKT